MVADHYDDKFNKLDLSKNFNGYLQPAIITSLQSTVSREEFETLKKDVLEMKELLKKAKEYDEKNNEPNCEKEEKIQKLRDIAKIVGIDLDEIFGKK